MVKLDNVRAAFENLSALYRDVVNQAIPPSAASVLLRITESALRIREKTLIEEQVANLEKQLEKLRLVIEERDLHDSESDDDLPESKPGI